MGSDKIEDGNISNLALSPYLEEYLISQNIDTIQKAREWAWRPVISSDFDKMEIVSIHLKLYDRKYSMKPNEN